MIRFSHKANSWQVDTPQGWVNIAPAQARFMVDRGVLLLTTGN